MGFKGMSLNSGCVTGTRCDLRERISLENVHYFCSLRHLEMGSSTIILPMRKFCLKASYSPRDVYEIFCMETKS